MGKIKVSFTTALFVFSFLVCVIVAVVFVDRSSKNDYDSFYESPAGNAEQAAQQKNAANAGWDPSQPGQQASPAQTPVPEASLSDLPIDAHLAALAVPVAPTSGATPAATQNPMAGRSPEQIARTLMDQGGMAAALQGTAIPGMAVPAGVATPATGAPAAGPAAPVATNRVYLPMQSNVQGSAPPGAMPGASSGYRGAAGVPDPTGGITNSGTWSPVAPQSTSANLIGVHKLPSSSQPGMMIGEGRIETGAQAPAGFSDAPTNANTLPVPSLQGSPATALPGSMEKPLLLPPQQDGGASKWELPPAPTLRPPPIQDPDQRRSEADETPGSLNPEEASSQAFAISEAETTGTSGDQEQTDIVAAAVEATATPLTPAEDIAAQVKDRTLTKDAAVRLARVEHKLNDKTLTRDDEKAEAEKAAEQWSEIQAAAEQARADNLTVGAPEVEHYAAMRPDFDPAEWQMTMEEEGFSAAEIRDQLEAIALSEKLIETKFMADVKDDDIKKAYEKSPSKYATPRKVRLQEIYKKRPADEERAQRVEREMKRLQRQAASGTDFGLLARQASEAPTAKRGGHLGWIDPAKEKDSARDKAIADLNDGGVSEVIDEDSGYRFYRLVEEKAAASDFDGAKETVVAELKKPVRKDAFGEVMKKLESGELNNAPVMPGTENKATAAAPKASPVVPTRSGSSLLTAGFEADAGAEMVSQPQEISAPGAASGTPADPANDPEAARKFKAQQLLGEVAAKRRAEERGEVYVPATEATASAAGTVMHEPGQQAQLLFAPGTQVQQMAGQPMQAQPMGTTAVPMQASMQMPNQASINYGVNHAGGQAQPQNVPSITPPPGYAMQQPEQQRQTQTESNGWNVTKTSVDEQELAARRNAAAAQQIAGTQPGNQAPMGAVPPGFEGNLEGNNNPAPAQNEPPRRGIVGNVRSFFGSIGR